MRDPRSARDEGGNSGDGRGQTPLKSTQGKRRDVQGQQRHVFESAPGQASMRPLPPPQSPTGGSHNGLKPPAGT